MSIDDIYRQLDEKLGIAVPEIKTEEVKTVQVVDRLSYEEEVSLNLKKLEEVQESAILAHRDLTDTARNFNKDRSYEVLAKLTDSITNSAKARNELLRDLYGKNQFDKKKPDQPEVTNNNIFVGSFRELLDQIPKTKTIVVQSQSDTMRTNTDKFQLHTLIENESKLSEFSNFCHYSLVKNEKTIDIVLNSAKDMNQLKFQLLDKYGQSFLI